VSDTRQTSLLRSTAGMKMGRKDTRFVRFS